MKVEPCVDCPDKVIDDYGYYCDLTCGIRTAWLNYLEGVKEMVEWIESHELISPDKDSLTRFEPFYQITKNELSRFKKGN